jgi:YesN/AraC family two-component response regulator
MVCNRCIMAVEDILQDLEFRFSLVTLGEVRLEKDISEAEFQLFASRLQSIGFEIIDDKKSRLIEKIKSIVIELVHRPNGRLKINLSNHLTENIPYDYNHLSSLFSEIEGTTIEKYFISQKIEKVKELLVYDELTLSQIADELGYSSVAHLSNQFKKVTGLTPSHFKNIKTEKRKPLDKV